MLLRSMFQLLLSVVPQQRIKDCYPCARISPLAAEVLEEDSPFKTPIAVTSTTPPTPFTLLMLQCNCDWSDGSSSMTIWKHAKIT